ncbi:scarecrow-like protein 14 isoform X1 [Selaginella moellendorffii]|uniref:scarecrow-like protein 14 isoform X1 n=2 Tax=Selaginella moellendorffii TaxID=88036 RepID=UPI000D1CEE1F|nr:scarecrow-like protein 14 isoform X1 [Selaginella moellendorffii]|eukprot:XP_024533477.1 scarecrow-like protein 14 isoform X1 [Selaginella moellendorffii]
MRLFLIMGHADLSSKLQRVLLQHQVRLKPVPFSSSRDSHETLKVYDDSRLQFIQEMLDQEDEPEDSSQEAQQVLSGLLDQDELQAPTSPASNPVLARSDGADLEGLLVACAEAVAANDSAQAYELVEELTSFAYSGESSLHRAVLYFTNALVARLRGYGAQMYRIMSKEVSIRQTLAVQMNLPVLRATEFFANQTILEACRGQRNLKLHIVDYGIFYGCQWPSLIEALSQRDEGPPKKMMITGIELTSIAEASMRQTGEGLIAYAKSCGVPLEFQPVVSNTWEKAEPRYHLSSDEFLVINCKLRMRHLREDGYILMESPRKIFFKNIARLKPALFVQCVVTTDLSSPFFIHRFREAWRDIHIRMEQIEETMQVIDPPKLEYLNRLMEKTVMNMVACEGADRIERLSSYKTWNYLATRAGFEKLPISNQALQMVKLVWTSHKKFTYGIDEKWLLLGWKDVTLTAMSAWQPMCSTFPFIKEKN